MPVQSVILIRSRKSEMVLPTGSLMPLTPVGPITPVEELSTAVRVTKDLAFR